MASSKRKARRRNVYKTGEKGANRVRLFPHPRDGVLFLEYRDEHGAKRRTSLGHRDINAGKQKADELAAELRKSAKLERDDLTLRTLFDKYEREVTGKKGAGKQKHDRAARLLFERCWGSDTPVKELGRDHWLGFIEKRRVGELAPAGSKTNGVRDRQVQYDLSYVRAALHWAMTVGSAGSTGRLLDCDPFHGLKRPAEEAPRQPIVTQEEFEALTVAAEALGEAGPKLFLLLAHETGHRGAHLRRLRWNDFDAEAGTMHWRKPASELADRKNFDHTAPLSPSAIAALKAAQRECGRIGDSLIFESLEGLSEQAARYLVVEWWQRLERKAGLARVRGRGWHSLRRKFGTEFKHSDAPLADVAKLGGWKGTDTLRRIYQQPDEQTMRGLFDKRRQLRAASN